MSRSLRPMRNTLVAMRDAEAKHGINYMGCLTTDAPEIRELLEDAVALGHEAKFYIEEHGDRSRFSVLMEEVGEVAEAMLAGDDADMQHELTQVAAMALAWLGVDYEGVFRAVEAALTGEVPACAD